MGFKGWCGWLRSQGAGQTDVLAVHQRYLTAPMLHRLLEIATVNKTIYQMTMDREQTL